MEPDYEKRTQKPHFRWKRWRTHLELGLLTKESISVDIILADAQRTVTLREETTHETEIENKTAKLERDHSIPDDKWNTA